jgi:hypothetical protein
MIKKVILFLLLACSMSCNSHAGHFTVFKKGSIMPQLVVNNDRLKASADVFSARFLTITGSQLQTVQKAGADAASVIELALTNTVDSSLFTLTHNDNAIKITAKDVAGIDRGIDYFFSHYTPNNGLAEIMVPNGLEYSFTPAFEYREPYFPDNFKAQFRKDNATQTLEETWGLWGHNIGKAVTATPQMMARVNGKVNDEQFCFSSPELFTALNGFIKNQAAENPGRTKFMVTPNDNDIVCQCDRCKALGNTKTNASPAVYTLLNKLAGEFPKLQFFSTAYITTQNPPSFKTAPNAGVMISTMAFPKGVVIEQSNKKDFVEQTFSGWKKVTDKIYLWEYAVNFDNYFKAFPTIAITQKNLQYYKKLGVTGVFMQGSEDMYSAYADLKCYLYAQLLMDTEIDVKEYTRRFFEGKYPSVANLLSGYYTTIDQRALASNKILDIYGGMDQARKKYLDEKEYNDFYTALYQKAAVIDAKELEQLKPLLASLTLIKLELMRTNGLGENGYASVAENGEAAVEDRQAAVLLERLGVLTAAAGIKVYNESGYTIADYLKYWHTEIISRPYKNLLYGKKVQFIVTPDEDYANAKILTDGAIGFQDYYNNWLLSTANQLTVSVNAEDVKGAKIIEMSFLNDTRHKIYLPQSILVTIGGRKFETKIAEQNSAGLSKYRAVVPVTIVPEDKTITIEVIKQEDYKKNSTACDEIFFK